MSRVYKIYLADTITFDKAMQVCREINQANSDDLYDSIEIVITSGGGKLYAMFAICDSMKLSKKPVDVLASGYCASAAVNILQSARRRRATMHTFFLLHHSHYEISRRPYNDLTIDMANHAKVSELFLSMVADRAGFDLEAFTKICEPKVYLTAQEALSFGKNGLIDEIVME